MNRIRLLFCIDNLEPDGAQRQLVDLVKNIDRSRYDISVCGIRGGSLKSEIEALGISVHVVGKRTWWELPWIALQLYKHVKDKKPLVLQSSLFYTNLLTGFIGRLLKVPIMVAVEHSVYSMHLSRWMGVLAALTRRLVDATVTVFEEKKIHRQGGVKPYIFRTVLTSEDLTSRWTGTCCLGSMGQPETV